jgi:alpha-aminoadipate carrier protein LysW
VNVNQEKKREGDYTMAAECPECACEIEADNVMVGEVVVCPDCGCELEVLGINPLQLGVAPEEDEDWGE